MSSACVTMEKKSAVGFDRVLTFEPSSVGRVITRHHNFEVHTTRLLQLGSARVPPFVLKDALRLLVFVALNLVAVRAKKLIPPGIVLQHPQIVRDAGTV